MSSAESGSSPSHATPPAFPQEDLSKDPLLRDLQRDPQGRPLLGRIPLVCRIGKGGMGAVYYAIHPRLQVEVAVKVLPFHLLDQDPKLAERFSAEARMAAGLSNHHVVRVLDVDQDEGTHFLVMEYVAGESAGAYLKRRKAEGKAGVDEREAVEIMTAAAKGITAAHERGIIHRDIKPDNILIPKGKTGLLEFSKSKVADLGLAKPEGGGQTLGTLSNVAMGTPGYMAPEQIEDARSAGRAADVFSMGATLYGLISGQAPFRGTSLGIILRDTMTKEPEALSDTVSEPVRQIVAQCLAKDQAERPADAGELLRALEAIAPSPVSAHDGATIPFEKTRILGAAQAQPRTKAPVGTPSKAPPASAAASTPTQIQGSAPRRRSLAPAVALMLLVLASGASAAGYYFLKMRTPPAVPDAPPLVKRDVPVAEVPRKNPPKADAPKPDPVVKPLPPKAPEAKPSDGRAEQRKRDLEVAFGQAEKEKDPGAALALWRLAGTFADDPKDIRDIQSHVEELEAVLARKKEYQSARDLARAERDLPKRLDLWKKLEPLAATAQAREEVRSQIQDAERQIKRRHDLDALIKQAATESDPAAAMTLWKQAGAMAEDPKDIKEIQSRLEWLTNSMARKKQFDDAAALAKAEPDSEKALALWQKAEGLADRAKDREDVREQIKGIQRKAQRRRDFDGLVAQAQAEQNSAAALALWKQARALTEDPKEIHDIETRMEGLTTLVNRKKDFDATAALARAETDEAKALPLWQKAQSLADDPKDSDEAREHLGELTKKNVKVYYDKGVNCWTNNDYAGAIDWLTRALELDPNLVYGYSYRGMAKRKRNDFDGAIEDATRAVEIDPKYSVGYANRGTAKYDKHDYDGAIADYTKAIEVDPRNPVFYQNRGNARLRKGDRSGASADFAYAQQLSGR